MGKLKRKNLVRFKTEKRAVSESAKEKIALAELVTIFNEEAYKICGNRKIAELIALNTLHEYLVKHAKNLKIVL